MSELEDRISDLESRANNLEIFRDGEYPTVEREVRALRQERDKSMQRILHLEDENNRLWKSVGALEEAIQALEFPRYMDCEETNEEGEGI